MNVLRHNHESNDLETVALTNLFEDLEKYVTGTCTAEERLAPIAARSNEMSAAADRRECGSGLWAWASIIQIELQPGSCSHPRSPPFENREGWGTHFFIPKWE